MGYDPNQTIGSVFTSTPAPYDSVSLIDGLSLMGGPDFNGGLEILLRAAIAGLLNRDFPSTGFINKVNAKIETGDRATIVKFATRLDNQNNGDCTAD